MNISLENKNLYVYYQNGNFVEFIESDSLDYVFGLINKRYAEKGLDWRNDIIIRVYLINLISKINDDISIEIYRIRNSSKIIVPQKAKAWKITLKYKDNCAEGVIYDDTDTTVYVLWEVLRYFVKYDFVENLDEINFLVEFIQGEHTQKSKLVTFFSMKENYGRLWTYAEAKKAMALAGLEMVGRGIEGERPREFRYAMGYAFVTSEKDKDVPDGYFIVKSPFPFNERNERRVANLDLKKTDWSELLTILQDNPTRLRCKICGLFEEETNRIGQSTKFQKGHALSHLSGGDVSESNIFAICQYCNTEQLNLYDIDPKTGKKKWNLIPVIEKRDYKTKLEILNYLKTHLRKDEIESE